MAGCVFDRWRRIRGREWAKILGLRTHDVPIGSASERVMIYAAYAFLILICLARIAVGLAELM